MAVSAPVHKHTRKQKIASSHENERRLTISHGRSAAHRDQSTRLANQHHDAAQRHGPISIQALRLVTCESISQVADRGSHRVSSTLSNYVAILSMTVFWKFLASRSPFINEELRIGAREFREKLHAQQTRKFCIMVSSGIESPAGKSRGTSGNMSCLTGVSRLLVSYAGVDLVQLHGPTRRVRPRHSPIVFASLSECMDRHSSNRE